MIELTKRQVDMLTTMANSNKNFVAYTSIYADGKACELIDIMFAEAGKLLEHGLVYDMSSVPRFKGVVEDYKGEGRTLLILAPTEMVKKMFGRTAWQNQIN